MTDRRKWQRVGHRLQVRVEPGTFVANSGDLSRGGIFLVTHRVLPRGTRVRMMLQLPGGWAEAEGEVCWAGPYGDGQQRGIGIRFTWMSPKAAAYIGRQSAPNRSMLLGSESPLDKP